MATSQFHGRFLRTRRTRSLGVNMTKDADPTVDQHVGYRLRMPKGVDGCRQRPRPSRPATSMAARTGETRLRSPGAARTDALPFHPLFAFST
jgi:hypothetical protein